MQMKPTLALAQHSKERGPEQYLPPGPRTHQPHQHHDPRFQPPGRERINFCCFSRPICGALQWQFQEMGTQTQAQPWPPRWASDADQVGAAHRVNPHPGPQHMLSKKTKLPRSPAPSSEQTGLAGPLGTAHLRPHSILQGPHPDLIANVLFILLWGLWVSGEPTSQPCQDTQPRVWPSPWTAPRPAPPPAEAHPQPRTAAPASLSASDPKPWPADFPHFKSFSPLCAGQNLHQDVDWKW